MDLRIKAEGEQSFVDTFDFFLKLSCFFRFCKVTKVNPTEEGTQIEYSFEQNPKERIERRQLDQIQMATDENQLHLTDVALVHLPDGQVVIHGLVNNNLKEENECSCDQSEPCLT